MNTKTLQQAIDKINIVCRNIKNKKAQGNAIRFMRAVYNNDDTLLLPDFTCSIENKMIVWIYWNRGEAIIKGLCGRDGIEFSVESDYISPIENAVHFMFAVANPDDDSPVYEFARMVLDNNSINPATTFVLAYENKQLVLKGGLKLSMAETPGTYNAEKDTDELVFSGNNSESTTTKNRITERLKELEYQRLIYDEYHRTGIFPSWYYKDVGHQLFDCLIPALSKQEQEQNNLTARTLLDNQ